MQVDHGWPMPKCPHKLLLSHMFPENSITFADLPVNHIGLEINRHFTTVHAINGLDLDLESWFAKRFSLGFSIIESNYSLKSVKTVKTGWRSLWSQIVTQPNFLKVRRHHEVNIVGLLWTFSFEEAQLWQSRMKFENISVFWRNYLCEDEDDG